MKYTVKHDPTDQNIRCLVEAAMIVEPEWVTVIRCAHEAGIKTSVGRHLGPHHLYGNQIEIKDPRSSGSLRRVLPDALHKYLLGLTGVTTHFCPRLHAMTTQEFANSWKAMCSKAGFKIHMIVLTWPYRNANEQRIKWEWSQCHLENLANDWLDESELEKLKADAAKWMHLGAKNGNRHRRLTRGQLLAPLIPNGITGG